MAFWSRKERIAIGFGMERIRLVVARANGSLERLYAGSAELPAGAVRGGLRAPALADREPVEEALRGLVAEARSAGYLRQRPEFAALVIPDACVKMALAPLEGDRPVGPEGARMARWVLRDLIPVDFDEIRADWSFVTGHDGEAAREWLLSVGAHEPLLAEYESLVRELGWSPGRLVPWTFAAAIEADSAGNGGAAAGGASDVARGMTLCDAEGRLACMFEADGVPRFHRAWRAPLPAVELAAELPSLRRYVADHLEMTLDSARLCGDDEWLASAEDACRSAGIATEHVDPETALLGVLSE